MVTFLLTLQSVLAAVGLVAIIHSAARGIIRLRSRYVSLKVEEYEAFHQWHTGASLLRKLP